MWGIQTWGIQTWGIQTWGIQSCSITSFISPAESAAPIPHTGFTAGRAGAVWPGLQGGSAGWNFIPKCLGRPGPPLAAPRSLSARPPLTLQTAPARCLRPAQADQLLRVEELEQNHLRVRVRGAGRGSGVSEIASRPRKSRRKPHVRSTRSRCALPTSSCSCTSSHSRAAAMPCPPHPAAALLATPALLRRSLDDGIRKCLQHRGKPGRVCACIVACRGVAQLHDDVTDCILNYTEHADVHGLACLHQRTSLALIRAPPIPWLNIPLAYSLPPPPPLPPLPRLLLL